MQLLTENDVNEVSGGNPILVGLAAAVLIYNAANIVYEFGQGVVEGYNSTQP